MSPDDIFAAQFWPWPDPAIKRDNQGRVLFVNAAFLQLYGGTVQDWTGNVVGGWPTPQGPGQPYRFETRIPMSYDSGEQVYDWIEMTLADGNAFALARNITLFMQPADPLPGTEIPAQIPQASVEHGYMGQESLDVDTQNHVAGNHIAEDIVAPAFETQDMSAQLPVETPAYVEAPQQASHEPVVFAEYTPEPEVLAQTFEEPKANLQASIAETGQPQIAQTSPQTPAMPPEITPAAVQVEASDIPNVPERSYERRALPIENESAVLGNNWRDAVIAKAVGADLAPAAEVAAVPEAITPDANDGPKRILLAEDNAINALLTRTLLEADGHTVETVQDGQLAVEAMKTSTYDLIFMDMRMPNMDGLEATRKIRTLPNVRKDLPIIALTANAFDDDRNACFDSGMNDFMTKPVSAEELSEMVGQWTKPQEERMAS